MNIGNRKGLSMDMTIKLPAKVNFIITTLIEAGYEAYAVGGCVRDSLLGRIPDDWDITTSALPKEVKKLFSRTIDTGIQHGTVTIMMEKEGFEVTTYRIDGEYEDSRHPKEVVYTGSLPEDLKRRDFTINAMAYNDTEGLIDEFNGIQDLENKIIRCVGNPNERFTEDALRIMRAIRFSAQLGYTIEEKTKEAIKKSAPFLSNISAERIQTELIKLVTSDHPDYLRIAYETGITKVFFPEFDDMMETKQNNPHHKYSVGEHTLESMKEIEADKILRLTMLFHDIGKPQTRTTDEKDRDHFYGHAAVSEKIAKQVLKRLKFDNNTISYVSKLVYFHDYKVELTTRSVRRAMNKMGEDLFSLLFLVKEADKKVQSDYQRKQKEENLRELKKIYDKVIADADCVTIKKLAITGSDLIAIGIKPGKEIGVILNYLLELVLEEPANNTAVFLLEAARKFVLK